MTVGQLLGACNSAELTLWQAFLQADAIEQEYRRESAKKSQELEAYVRGE